MEVDPEFMKYLERVRALPEAKKKEIRDHLLAEAGIKPPEDKKSDQSCGDNLNREALDAAAREWTPVLPHVQPGDVLAPTEPALHDLSGLWRVPGGLARRNV